MTYESLPLRPRDGDDTRDVLKYDAGLARVLWLLTAGLHDVGKLVETLTLAQLSPTIAVQVIR